MNSGIDNSGISISDFRFTTQMGRPPLVAELLYRCSHDMCSPVKTMDGLISLLENYNDKSLENDCINLLAVSLDKLEALLDKVDQIRYNEENLPGDELISLPDLVAGVTSRFEREIYENGLVVSVNIDQKFSFSSDFFRIHLSLTHLFSNAIMFSDEKKKNRTIEISVIAKETGCFITVEDNGIGMERSVHEKLFEPFFRGSWKSNGAGLGLFVANAMIKKLGGALSVDSETGRGSVFTLWIPDNGERRRDHDWKD
ncbi:MAG: HAMP domain-containing sensor histidine kinase [Cyclobacteriaceae bacterium]